MVSVPWYLLAAGIAIMVIGFILAGLPRSSERDWRAIDPDMRDDDIADELNRAERLSVPGLVILAGILCVLVSVGWRLARAVL